MKPPPLLLCIPLAIGGAALKSGFPPAFRRKLKRMNADAYRVVTKNHRDYDNQFKTLAAVLGSEKAAKKSFLWSFPLTTTFSAILTRDEFDRISKHPDVNDVVQDLGRKAMLGIGSSGIKNRTKWH